MRTPAKGRNWYASFRMASSRLPNLVIAGVGKAGTTSLFSYLAQHPYVCASSVKEVNYFTPLKHGEELESVDFYAQYFSHCGREKYVMEATPGYFYGGMPLISAMKETLPDTRVLVSLRDPSPRLWSYFNFMKTRLKIEKELTLDKYLETALDLRARGMDRLREYNPYWALSSGFYSDYISDWFETFGSAFRVVFFEDLVKEPRGVITQICDWLGIESGPTSRLNYSAQNQTVLYKNKRLQEMALAVNDRGERFFRRHPEVESALRRIYYRFNKDHEPLRFDPAARRRLDAVYASSNEALATELSSRGYDQFPEWLRASEPNAVAS
jgi:hypothetical protein